MATNIPLTGEFKITGTFGQTGGAYGSAPHSGVDMVGISSDIIYGTCDGVVIFAGNNGDGFGNYVCVRGNEGDDHYYAHMRDFLVKSGNKINRLTALGHVGSTGNATGPHVHYEIRDTATRAVKNPAEYMKVPNTVGTYRSADYQLTENQTPPEEAAERSYVVKEGDTLYKIAAQFSTTYQELAAYNHIENPAMISVGQVIKIPSVTGEQPPEFPGAAYFGKDKRNDYVTWLGKMLVHAGFGQYYHDGPGPAWSESDRLNCRAFQISQGWGGSDADGYPGPETWKRLTEIWRK